MASNLVYQYRADNSVLHRLDPLTKLVALLAVSLLAFGVYIAWVQIAVTLFILFSAIVLGGISPFEVVRGTWLFIIACTSFFFIQAVSLPGAHVAFHVLGHPVMAEAVDYALASALRIYAVLLASLVFVRTTDPRALAIAMVEQVKVPYRIAYAFFIALRIVPTIEEEIKIIRAAQRVRGVALQRGLMGRFRDMKRYAMPVLVGSLRRASTMAMSMESRAFGAYPTRTFIETHRMGLSGAVTCTVLVLAVIAWYTALTMGWVHSVYVMMGT